MTPTSNLDADVLVAGAGPTGLVLALWLRRLGISVRVIDKAATAGTTSRALAVQARTLEFYRQVGIADAVVARGLEFAAVNLWVRGEHAARAAFSDIGEGMSPFPFITIFPQDQHERLLVEHLERAGIEVERRTELAGFEERGDHVVARLEGPDGRREEIAVRYLAGCDGAHSKVRDGLAIAFPGGTYERVYYVADVELRGRAADHELHIALDTSDLLAIFPMKGEGKARFIGTVREDAVAGRLEDLTWNDVSHSALERVKVEVANVNWFSTYRVHHRVAEHFARGRAFLLGDAAHVHSPVGGQGMNTGIGDAVNLAWKLAATLRGCADASLLSTYEPERVAFAKRLVATTDRLFTVVTKGGPLARGVRLEVVPRILPRLMARKAVRRWVFRTISQTAIHYRQSSWSEGRAGNVRGGDRLPWVRPDAAGGADNYTPLGALDWQVHVYGEAAPATVHTCEERGIPIYIFPWREPMVDIGFEKGAAYLVRPDGYVALAEGAGKTGGLARYLEQRKIKSLRAP